LLKRLYILRSTNTVGDLFRLQIQLSIYLDSLVAAEVEIELGGMRDAEVDGGASGDVPRLARLLLLVRTEQSRVVPLLHHYERDARLIFSFQLKQFNKYLFILDSGQLKHKNTSGTKI
jgi:hypothetical protein